MNIFQEMKERVTARQVAERYGLKVRRNGMACCPFHNDKHPSMKINQNYYCFACGAKGDAVNYVAVQFGLSQFEAAKKINEDFSLGILIGQPELMDVSRSSTRNMVLETIRLCTIRLRVTSSTLLFLLQEYLAWVKRKKQRTIPGSADRLFWKA